MSSDVGRAANLSGPSIAKSGGEPAGVGDDAPLPPAQADPNSPPNNAPNDAMNAADVSDFLCSMGFLRGRKLNTHVRHREDAAGTRERVFHAATATVWLRVRVQRSTLPQDVALRRTWTL